MDSVWLVTGSEGEWSDYTEWVESVWDSEAGAVSHIVRELGAEFDEDDARCGYLTWTLEHEGGWPTTSYEVVRREVCHGG